MKYFIANDDTNSDMSWQDFKKLLVDKDFILAMEYDIKHPNNIDEFVIYYNLPKGMILWATSYCGKKVVNSGTLYAEIQANSKDSVEIIWENLSTGGIIDRENLIFETSHDIREGLFSKLEILESAGKFLPKWTNKNRFLYFVDYVENKVKDYDYKKITKEKLLNCPKELQEIVGINIGGN